MSMLAERKRKQKWSLNPRGKDWAQDTSKFGHKMLERMGWSQGKGLGARENGITEHIKVSYKNDSKGLGHKDRNDQWTEHESNFSALLSSLGGTENSSNILKVSSLEEKSQKSRARVHYKKFTRGKDLTRYSEKDLANIFGKKSLDELRKSRDNKTNGVAEESDSNEINQPSSSFIINSGLINDYFKKKLPNFGNINGFIVGNNGVLKKAENSDSDTECRPSFGFGFKSDKASKVLGIKESGKPVFFPDQGGQDSTPKKNKKKRNADDIIMVETETPTKKKKEEAKEDTPSKRKNHKENLGLSNPAFDPMHSTPIKLQRHTLDIIEESISEDTIEQQAEHLEVSVQVHENTDSGSKKKKKKKYLSEENLNSGDDFEKNGHALDFSEDSLEISSNGKKKKKREFRSAEHLGDSSFGNQDSLNDGFSKIKKKKNKTRSVEALSGVENPYYNVSMEGEEPNSVEMLELPKKKSKKNKNSTAEEVEGVENPFFNIGIESEDISSSQNNPYEVKTKEKKKKKKKNKLPKETIENGLENPNFVENSSGKDSTNEEFEVRRKKSEKEKPDVGLDNPALNLSVSSIVEDCELMLNIATIPVDSKVVQKENDFKITKSVQRRKSVRFSDVTRERIIPTKEEIKKMEESQDSDIELDLQNDSFDIEGRLKSDGTEKSSKLFRIKKKTKINNISGLDNKAYDAQKNNLEENLDSISKTLDQYQAELENDINEAKMKSVEISDIMIGEVGNPHGENEVLPDGSVKLKFKHAKLRKSFKFHDAMLGPKKPYRHLIKGDITLDFKESNLHEIHGYASEKSV